MPYTFRSFAASFISLAPWIANAAVDLGTPAGTEPVFPLVANHRAAPICIPKQSAEVVRIAARDLAKDIETITGVLPEVRETTPNQGPSIQVSISAEFAVRWETFRLSASEETLKIVGSDRRALAFGIYDLSRRIGVSPWYWWADVPIAKRDQIHLTTGTGPIESPAVRYRGVFLNDEDWGLRPWAAETFEPETGNIGPKTYARIFELLLRLRANTIWPAMHPGTKPFHQVPGNNKVADNYAIVVGSSHAEPMLRNNVGEWTKPANQYDFTKCREAVLDYWQERVRQRAHGESLFTLGMRGIHDSPIMGPKDQAERIQTLETIFKEQRSMIEKNLGPSWTPCPGSGYSQIFCPYKEVLDDYKAGLKVPDDVTMLWPDDNFGYIRHFPTPDERRRAGGSGVYYHLSYLGAPISWLWFDSLSPALVWSEMTRAYEQGACSFWVANVGDLKNLELSTEFFLHLAWRAGNTTPDEPARFLHAVAARDFGQLHGDAVADIWTKHQHLATARKPEHLQWHMPQAPYQPTEFTEQEMRDRLDSYAALLHDADSVASALPVESQDAYFERVGYPVAVAAAANERYFRAELARLQLAGGHGETAKETFAMSERATQRIAELTERYNEQTAGGKWRHIVRVNGVQHEGWLPKFLSSETLPLLESSAQNAVRTPEPAGPSSVPMIPNGGHPGDFIERDGVVSINAGNFGNRHDLRDGSSWRSIPGLGRTGSAVTVIPSTAPISNSDAPSLAYRFHVTSGGPATFRVRLLPTYPIVTGRGLRLALKVDHGSRLSMAAIDGFDPTNGFDPKSKEWSRRVLANATEATLKLPEPLTPGWHTLQLVAVDTGVVVDKILIDLGGLRPSYDGPPETRIH